MGSAGIKIALHLRFHVTLYDIFIDISLEFFSVCPIKLAYFSHQCNIAETGSVVNVIANVTHAFIGSVLLNFDCCERNTKSIHFSEHKIIAWITISMKLINVR